MTLPVNSGLRGRSLALAALTVCGSLGGLLGADAGLAGGGQAGAAPPKRAIRRKLSGATSTSARFLSTARTVARATTSGEWVPISGDELAAELANMPASPMYPGNTVETPTSWAHVVEAGKREAAHPESGGAVREACPDASCRIATR